MAEPTLDYVVVDVFTAQPLTGNPLAVFTDAASLDGETMQRLARELNLSETVFVTGPLDAEEVPVRIFTPTTELPFAGHPTLGTACVVSARTGATAVRLRCEVGVVPVAMGSGSALSGEMAQPIPRCEPFAAVPELLAGLRIDDSALPVEIYDNGVRHVYAMLRSRDEVRALVPDLGALAELGVIGVNCFSVDGDRVHTRMFGPGLGVAEDAATGSAAGPLAVHLGRHGVVAYGTRLAIEQGVELRRPSLIEAVAEAADETITGVRVGGQAVIVAEGRFVAQLGSGTR